MNPYKSKSYYAAVMGVMLALAVALTTFESMLSAFLPMSGFGLRLGLSNVIIMAAALMINPPSAFLLTVMKSLFVALTRGFTAGFMSACGGIPAFLVMILLFRKTKTSYIMVSVLSSLTHMAGQLTAASILLKSVFSLYYAPMLIFAGILLGVCTGIILSSELKKEWRFLVNENFKRSANQSQQEHEVQRNG